MAIGPTETVNRTCRDCDLCDSDDVLCEGCGDEVAATLGAGARSRRVARTERGRRVRLEETELTLLSPLARRCADALADEVAVLVRRRVIDARSPAGDALLDYRDPPSTPRADRLAQLDAAVAETVRWLEETHASAGDEGAIEILRLLRGATPGESGSPVEDSPGPAVDPRTGGGGHARWEDSSSVAGNVAEPQRRPASAPHGAPDFPSVTSFMRKLEADPESLLTTAGVMPTDDAMRVVRTVVDLLRLALASRPSSEPGERARALEEAARAAVASATQHTSYDVWTVPDAEFQRLAWAVDAVRCGEWRKNAGSGEEEGLRECDRCTWTASCLLVRGGAACAIPPRFKARTAL